MTINVSEGAKDIHPIEHAAIAHRAATIRLGRLRGYLIDAIVEAHKQGMAITKIADLAGVSRETIYEWLRAAAKEE